MQKAAHITVRVLPAMRERIERLADALGRPKSYVIENALSSYLDANEWQIAAIREAVAEAESPDAELIEQEKVEAKWKAKVRED